MLRASLAGTLGRDQPESTSCEDGDEEPMTVPTWTADQLRLQLAGDRPVLVDWRADWCTNCAAQEKVIERLAPELETKVVSGKIDVGAYPDLADEFGVQSLPDPGRLRRTATRSRRCTATDGRRKSARRCTWPWPRRPRSPGGMAHCRSLSLSSRFPVGRLDSGRGRRSMGSGSRSCRRTPDTGAYTRLLRFEPGVSSEPNGTLTHEFWEEVFIVQGDLTDLRLGETFTAGMYACRPPGHAPRPVADRRGRSDGRVPLRLPEPTNS